MGTILSGAYLNNANLSSTNLRRASLNRAYLNGANLSGADLSGANLARATLVETDLTKATLKDCQVYGISAWDVQLEEAKQDNLTITPVDELAITVDDLEVAQFIYLLLNNQKIRQTIDTITSQVVLVLGSFPPDRKEVIDALSTELRSQKYSPVVFNFEGTDDKDFTATVRTLANMAHFVLIDLTDLNDAIHEIADTIVPYCVVPIRPLLHIGSHRQEDELFREPPHKHRWVLAPYRYKDLSDLQNSFQEKILQPIHEKISELKEKKPIKIFIGCAPEDKKKLKQLQAHLRSLKEAGLIELWDNQDVTPGEEKRKEIERRLFDAQIILLFISSAYLGSDDFYIQMSMALERHSLGDARVIPLLLRPCDWQSTPLKELQPLPKDGKPVSKHNIDEVFTEVSKEIGNMLEILR